MKNIILKRVTVIGLCAVLLFGVCFGFYCIMKPTAYGNVANAAVANENECIAVETVETPTDELDGDIIVFVDDTNIEETDCEMSEAEEIKRPMTLFSQVSSAGFDSSYILTATITPSFAYNQVVDWLVSWQNPSSSWATGKNVSDYVTITPTSDGALTATLASSGLPFGEQVVVTCRIRNDHSVYATATVDYYRRVIGGEFTYIRAPLNVYSNALSDSFTDCFVFDLGVDMEEDYGVNSYFSSLSFTSTDYSAGTLNDSFTYSYSFSLSDELGSFVRGLGYRGGNSIFRFTDLYLSNILFDCHFFDVFKLVGPWGTSAVSDSDIELITNKCIQLSSQDKPIAYFHVRALGDHCVCNFKCPIKALVSSLGATGITLNDSSFAF